MSMSVRLMRLKKLCDLWFAGAAHRDSEGEIGELAIFGFNRNAIDVKKDQCCCSTSPFIPINEWMVHHYVEQVRGSHLKGKRVKINTIEACSRLLDCRLQKVHIANLTRAAIERGLIRVNLHYVAEFKKVDICHLLSQPAQVVFELRVDLFETRFDFLLTCFITAWSNKELVAIRAYFERGIGGNLEHIQDWLVYHESQTVPVFDQHFLHRFVPFCMVSQSVYRNSGEVKLSLNPHAIPTAVLEQIHVLGAAVPRELVESCTRRHDNRAITVGESFRRSVVGERTNIAACDQRSCRLDRCVMFFEDSAGMVLVAVEVKIDRCVATILLLAGNRCSCGHRMVSLLRWFVVVGFDDGDTIVGHRQHERAAVVPVDIDLRPIVMLVNVNDGTERSNRYRVWILWHRYQADAIAFLQSCLHSYWCLVSFRRCGVLVEHNEVKVLVGSCRLKGWFGNGWFLVVGETKDDRQQSASKSRKHQANMRACFAKFLETCGCAGESQFRDVSRCVALWAYIRINEKTPTRYKRGAIGGKRSVLRSCLQVVRYQDGSAVAEDGNRVSVSRSGEQRGTLADHIHHAADVELAIVDRSQVVGDAWLWCCGLAVGQVIHRSQIVKVFHRLGLLASNRESSAFGLYELAVVALGQVAKDRAVQRRVWSLASRACPIALRFHRRDQLLCVHRFTRFAKDFQGRSDAAQTLLTCVGGLSGFGLGFAWLLENRNRCGRIAPDRFDRGRLVLNHRYVAFGGDLRASALRTHFAQKALSALNENLLAGCEVGCIPATARFLGIDLNLASVARNVREVLATNLYFCLLHLRFSKSVFVVGCHRQADRTTDRLRASVLRFGLLTKDQVRQSLAEKVDYHLDLRSDRRHIQATVEVEHHFAVGQALNPKLRNLALVQLVRFVFCVLGEDQRVETVFVVDLALHPRSASAAVAITNLDDRQVEVVLGHLLVSVAWLVNRFRVNTHEPCGLNRIKPDSKGIRILFFGAYLRSEMLGELRCGGLHICQFVEELFHGRWVGSGEDRHLFDRCVQVADCLQRLPVCAEELGRGQAWSVGHSWHRGDLRLFVFDMSYAMTHMSHAVQTASSRRGKDSEGFSEPFPRRIGVSQSTIATCFPSSFAAVADLPAFDDVDRVVVGNVLGVVVFILIVGRVVHVASAGNAADPVFEGPVLLGHQPHFGVASAFFAVVVEDFDQGVEIHVWFSVWVNENWLCDNTHEPCGLNNLKPISAAFSHVLPCFSGGLTGPDVGPCCDFLNVGYLVEGSHKNATAGECRDQAEERRASVRGVRGIPLVCGLEDLSKAAVLHRVQSLDRVEVFGEKRAGAGCLLCVGDLKGFCQGHQTLDCLVVGFADLLGLVGIHRLEDLAKGCVGGCVWVVCVGHVCVSVSEIGLNRLRDDTHEPCGFDNLKPSMREFGKDSSAFFPACWLSQKFAYWEDAYAGPLLTIYAKEVERGPKESREHFAGSSWPPANPRCSLVFPQEELEQFLLLEKFCKFRFGLACSAEVTLGEIDPGHAAWLVGQQCLGVFDRTLSATKHVLSRLVHAAHCIGDHPFEPSQLVRDRLFGARLIRVVHLCFSVWEREWNRLRDDTHEPCGLINLKPFTAYFQNVFRSFLAGRVSHNVRVYCVRLDLGYSVACSVKNATVRKCCDQAEERRDSVRGVLCGSGLGRAVVFAGELEEFGFDRLPFRFGFAGDLSVDLIAKGTLVPTFGPSESVEQSVEFGLTKAGTRAIPATLGTFLLDVIPFAASFGVEGEFNQTQNHHQVSDHLGLVERSAEGPEFDSVLAASQVGQVQQVVAIRFASALGVVFVAVLFDSLGVHHLFAFAGSGRSVDRSFVVSDQGNQSCQGGCVSVPANRYVQTAAGIYSAPASVDLVDSVLDLTYAFSPFEYWAYKLASFARGVLGSDASIAFCFPSGWQPRYLVSAVVRSDRCVVSAWEGGFEFNSEGDFVCVHRSVPLWFEVFFASRFLRRDDTHEPCVSRNIQPIPACFSSNFACFLRGHRCPNITPPARPNMLRITRRTCG
jgi:hypothetical protein